jgi:hypothetical protein
MAAPVVPVVEPLNQGRNLFIPIFANR